ncbi:MAG: 50S ribosomal protein L16 [Candidatus Sungbacteria bacterium]|nr:50S ribosomal protein L16 [Candidatus Sungbacteria bacterium]
MLQPRKVKHRKWQKGQVSNGSGVETRGTTLAYGSYGLKAVEPRWITARQIEAARRAITHYIQRGGKVWIRIFPDKPITRRPPEVTMGGGKGSVEFYVSPVRSGRILFEMDGVSEETARQALRRAAAKLPVKTRFVVASR